MALARRRPQPELVHHSDRGVQYASRDYTQLLHDHGIRISMSRPANPWHNAACESFIKTLKYEEVYRTEYRDLAEARAGLAQARQNGKRLGRPLTAALQADQVRKLYGAGLSKAGIARRLIIGRTSVRRILASKRT